MSTANANTLLSLIRALEVELHHPGAPCSSERLEQLLHPEFHEVGRSGNPYDRHTVIRYLATLQAPADTVSDQFALIKLGASTALLTYRSAQRNASQQLTNHTLRSSIWIKAGQQWQLRYHQGTPAATPW